MFQTINPATQEILASYPVLEDVQVEHGLSIAAAASRDWARSSIARRSAVLNSLADRLETEKATHARTITVEMGKTFLSAIAELEKCAACCRWYADNAEALLASETIALPHGRGEVRYLPIGVVFAIMPWNFPFWQVVRFLAPALLLGNAAILKHAPSTPQSALALVDLLSRAGLPTGVFQSMFIDNDQAARVIADPRVGAVTLTGSERAGQAVGAAAGAALKRCVLELGGSDPFIVLPSADLDAAVKSAVLSRNQNNGQSCVSAKRFIVHADIYDQFASGLTEATSALRVGDPFDPATDVGPLSSMAARDRIAAQVEGAIGQGASLLTGGVDTFPIGAYFSPTVLANVPSAAPVRQEELFGPAAMLFRARDLDAAIEIANDIPFGLGSSLWTNDLGEQAAVPERLECGMTFINAMTASDPRLPFGGLKRSGFGRELGRWGMQEFANVKTIFRA